MFDVTLCWSAWHTGYADALQGACLLLKVLLEDGRMVGSRSPGILRDEIRPAEVFQGAVCPTSLQDFCKAGCCLQETLHRAAVSGWRPPGQGLCASWSPGVHRCCLNELVA